MIHALMCAATMSLCSMMAEGSESGGANVPTGGGADENTNATETLGDVNSVSPDTDVNNDDGQTEVDSGQAGADDANEDDEDESVG
jgi:hypothetical protein